MTSVDVRRTTADATWVRGLAIQVRVIRALMIRDALSRFGHENMGFFWVVGEPLLFSCGIMLLWSLARMTHGDGVDVIPFALTGYSYVTMWRHITGRSIGAIRHHANLAFHRHVKLIDAIVAMALLEAVGCFSSFMVAYVPLWLLGFCPTMSDPLVLIGGFALASAFSFGFGLLLAGLSQTNEIVRHLMPAVMYMSLPLTGIFTLQAWLPEQARQVFSWSPLVNGIEMVRGGLFPPEVETYWSAGYLALCAMVSIVVGYAVFASAQRSVQA